MIEWPDDLPLRFNACTDPCDMLVGPCACGATHLVGEFDVDEMRRKFADDLHRINFAYSNLACSTNHKPGRAAFGQIATTMIGWNAATFERWAAGKTWTQ